MANVQLTDLVVIGRGGTSYNTLFSDLKDSVLDGLESSNDAKYVLVDGDTMTGFLTLSANPTQALHAVTKQYVDAIETSVNDNITTLSTQLQAEVDRATGVESSLETNLATESDRAQQSESDLHTKIDTLVLDDLTDVSVDGASEDQYLVYNGTNWVSRTPENVVDALQFQGSIDCTTEEAPGDAVSGWFYYNSGDGNAIASWTGITTVVAGDRVVYGSDNEWHILGNVNDGGNLTLDSLSVTTLAADGNGSLAYNNETGVFSFTPSDLTTTVPKNLSLLPSLPTS